MNDKLFKIILICILSLIIVVLTLFLILALTNNSITFNKWSINSKNELITEENYKMDEVNDIKVNTRSSDVRFIINESHEITVKVYGNKDINGNISLEDGNLNVEYMTSNFCFGFCFEESYIEISIPSDYAKNIEISTVSGDVFIPNLKANKMEIKTVSGDVEVDNSNVLKAVTTSGDIKIVNGNSLDLKTVSGDIDVDNVTEQMNIQTTSGDVEINKANIIEKSNIKTVSGEVEISKLNEIRVEVSTTSGDEKIRNTNQSSNIILDITTTSGDIKIN